jgi:hypothetical protein
VQPGFRRSLEASLAQSSLGLRRSVQTVLSCRAEAAWRSI